MTTTRIKDTPPPDSPPYPHDEIDLRELLIALWNKKLLIITCTVVGALIAIQYALTAQEWWTAKAKITQPSLTEYKDYYHLTQSLRLVLDTNSMINAYSKPSFLLNSYIDLFNTTRVKEEFIANSTVFNNFLAKNSINDEQVKRRSLKYWTDNLVLSEIKESDDYTLKAQATSANSSLALLTEYDQLIRSKVIQNTQAAISIMITSRKNQLQQQLQKHQIIGHMKLSTEIARLNYSAYVARAAGIASPTGADNDDTTIFSINEGHRALDAKIEAFEDIKKNHPSVYIPEINQLQSQLQYINTIEPPKALSFSMYRYIDEPKEPFTRDEPKRALLVILGTLLGGMLGVVIALLMHAFRGQDETPHPS